MEKCDKDFLNLYVKSFAIISASRMVAITSADTREFVYVSQSLLKLLKQKTCQLEGKKLCASGQITPYINEYTKLFKQVVQHNSPISALIAHDFDNNGTKSIKLLNKTPLISLITGKIIAVIDEIKDFTINHEVNQFIQLINHMVENHANINREASISLTKRQKEILFLLSLGKSPKNIAEFISRIENKILSPATVTATINKHLYAKFAVNSTSQLIEKAILLGFVSNIPDTFIRNPGVLMVLN